MIPQAHDPRSPTGTGAFGEEGCDPRCGIGASRDDALPDPTAPIVKYAIVVKTADVRGAGTDVPCFIEINGTRNGSAVSSGPVELHNGSRRIQRAVLLMSLSVHGPDFDMVTHIGLGHSSTAPGIGWRPASVELRGSRSEHAVDFIVDRIIPVEGKELALVGLAPGACCSFDADAVAGSDGA